VVLLRDGNSIGGCSIPDVDPSGPLMLRPGVACFGAAAVASLLASDDSCFMTGSAVFDGGMAQV